MRQLLPGDFVFFRRGDSFDGSIAVTKSGTVTAPIIFGAYGTGAKPIINGCVLPTSFTSVGGGIFESNALATGPIVNQVIINGVEYAMGRFPNADAPNGGYLSFETSGTNQITDNELTSTPNWTGADVVIRSSRWTLDELRINNHTGTTIQYATPATYKLINRYGYFIHNSEKTLDQFGEWYYDSATKKVKIFFGTAVPPNTEVRVSTIDNLLNIGGSNITVENLNIWGSNGDAVRNTGNLQNITLRNCYFLNSGINAISFTGESPNITIDSCTISNTNNNAITLTAGCINATITRNVVNSTGIIAGMGKNGNGNYNAIRCDAPGLFMEKNRILKCGLNAISFSKDNVTIQYNLIDSFCMVKDDGAGIYTSTGSSTIFYNRKIIGNIILNGVGAKFGIDVINSYIPAIGIYLDDNATHIDVIGNTVANCTNLGMNVHNAKFFSVINNTFYNNFTQFATSRDIAPITDGIIKNNFFISRTATQNTASYRSVVNDANLIGVIDSNIYARPIADSASIKVEFPNMGWGFRTLAYWQTYVGKDFNSKRTAKTIRNVNEFDFKYNATDRPIVYYFLGLSKMDVAGKVFNNSIIIPAWGSRVLLANGTTPIVNQAPLANTGNDTAITLPANTVTLTGIASDIDGTVSSYRWVKVSGPSAGTITKSDTAVTTLNGLVSGVYQYELTVTDNNGAIGKDTLKITVNTTLNVIPVSRAGVDVVMTLPINSTTLAGTGTDADGTVSSFVWSKIAGPSGGLIVSPNVAITSINSLVQGIYQFELTVTDNNGARGKDTLQITINAAINIRPVANAGVDIFITLPVNTATLNGSGTDADGTISSFAWIKLSGPLSGNLVSANSAVAILNTLVQGVYQYQLTVTDNGGAIASDTVQVTVNAALNITPVSNAGVNISITLPVNTATLNGSGTDADGTISSFAWIKLSGPLSGNLISANSAVATLNSLVQGVYQYQLTVTDNGGAIARDMVQVTVNAGLNIAPVSIAGVNISITLPVNTATLNGIGADADGTISSYAWVKITGPATGNIISATTASTVLNNLVQGVYLFELTVTDNSGAIARDTLQVTVKAIVLSPAVNPLYAVNGLDYKYYEGYWSFLPLYETITPIKTGTTPNFDITLANRSRDMGFSFTGYVEVPTDGIYTFFTTSDDGSNLYIDNILIVDNDGLHGSQERFGTIGLRAGKHFIKGLYFQGPAGLTFSVSYQSSSIAKQTIPLSALFRDELLPSVNPLNTINGLDYKYYEGSWSVLPLFDLLTPVKSGTTTNFNISLANRTRDMGFSFTGYVDVPVDGLYTFFTTSDDGSSLYIDDVLTVNNDGQHTAIEKSGVIGLKAGKHFIKGLYFQGAGGTTFFVSYQSNDIAKKTIPLSVLYRLNITPAARSAAPIRTTTTAVVQNITKELSISCYPNPSSTDFAIKVDGNSVDKVDIIVINPNGNIVYKTSGYANTMYRFGKDLKKGVYLIEVFQNKKTQNLKVIKM